MALCELYIAMYFVVPMDEDTWRTAARIWGHLPKGSKLRKKDGDVLIAAAAVCHNFVVLTHNGQDFQAIQRVEPKLQFLQW